MASPGVTGYMKGTGLYLAKRGSTSCFCCKLVVVVVVVVVTRLLEKEESRGILPLNKETHKKLREKHPLGSPATDEAFLQGETKRTPGDIQKNNGKW